MARDGASASRALAEELEALRDPAATTAAEEPRRSWWSASVGEVQGLGRLIDEKLSKAAQLTSATPDILSPDISRSAQRAGSSWERSSASPAASAASPTEGLRVAAMTTPLTLPLASSPSAPSAPAGKAAAAASAAAAVYTVAAAMDVSALREEVARLAAQVESLEGQPSGGCRETLETKVDDLRRNFAVLKEQMHSLLRERQKEGLREQRKDQLQEQLRQGSNGSQDSSSIAAVRQELDDLRARWAQLSRQVEEQCQATKMCFDDNARSTGRFDAFRKEQKEALRDALMDLRKDFSQNASSREQPLVPFSQPTGTVERVPCRRELSAEIAAAVAEIRREVIEELSESARDVAQKAASQAAREAAKTSARDAAKEAALRAANETAREVAHIAAFEAVDATAEKAREAAREVTEAADAERRAEASRLLDAQREVLAEVAALRAENVAPGAVRSSEASLSAEANSMQSVSDMRGELSAAMAAMSTEVTSSCNETSRTVAACQEEIHARYNELLSMIQHLQTGRFSKMRGEVDALRRESSPLSATSAMSTQDRSLWASNEVAALPSELEPEADGAERGSASLSAVVTTLQRQIGTLRSKLQHLEGELCGDTHRAGAELRLAGNASRGGSFSFDEAQLASLQQREVDSRALQVAEAALTRQRGMEAEVRRLRVEAAHAEPVLQALKAECEDLRVSLRQGLERLNSTQAPAVATQDAADEFESRFLGFVTTLGDEFDKTIDTIHAKKLEDVAVQIGQEFDAVFREESKLHKEMAEEFRQNYNHLERLVHQLLQRQVSRSPRSELQVPLDRLAQPGAAVAYEQAGDRVALANGGITKLDMSACAPDQPYVAGDRCIPNGGHAEQVYDKVVRIPHEFEKLRNEHNAKLADLAKALGEEFDNTHKENLSESLTGFACALGDEFEMVHAEKQRPLEVGLEELQQNQIKLAEFVHTMLAESGKAHASLLDEFRQNRAKISSVFEDLSDRQAAQASEMETMRQQCAAQAAQLEETKAAQAAQREEAEKVALVLDTGRGTTQVPEQLQETLATVATLPLEVEAFRRDQNAKLEALAENFSEELQRAQSERLTSTISDIACALGEEFDRVHEERSQPVEKCLTEIQQNQERAVENQERLAKLVQDMQQSDLQQRPDNLNGEMTAGEIECLMETNTEFVEELRSNFEKLSNVVEELLQRQTALASDLDDVRRDRVMQTYVDGVGPASPQGIDRSPISTRVAGAANSLESTSDMSDSKRDILGKPSPGELSDEPSALPQEADVASNMASELVCELDRAGVAQLHDLHRKVDSVPLELEALRREQGTRLASLAEALGEEFERVHTSHMTDVAAALGEEFDRAHSEKHGPLQARVADLQQNQERLCKLVDGITERHENDSKYIEALHELNPKGPDDTSSVIQRLVDTQTVLASELATLRRRCGDKVDGESGETDLLEEVRSEQHAKLAAMADALGEEFEQVQALRISDMACALGEEFDRVHGEASRNLQGKLMELQQGQAKLAAIVLKQEYETSLTEYNASGVAADSSKPRAEIESLCCFVRAEVEQKVMSIRQEMQRLQPPRANDPKAERLELSAMRQELIETCKAAQGSHEEQFTRLFRITQDQAALLEEILRRHAGGKPLELSPSKALQLDGACSPLTQATPERPEDALRATVPAKEVVQVGPAADLGSALTAEAQETAVESKGVDAEVANSNSPERDCASTAVVGDPSDEVQEYSLAQLQSPELEQCAQLQLVMEENLRRARLALDSMPTFGAPDQLSPDRSRSPSAQTFTSPTPLSPSGEREEKESPTQSGSLGSPEVQRVPVGARCALEAWDSSAIGDTDADADGLPFSGRRESRRRWLARVAAPVPPGLKAQASEMPSEPPVTPSGGGTGVAKSPSPTLVTSAASAPTAAAAAVTGEAAVAPATREAASKAAPER